MTGRSNTEAERVAITLRKVSRTKAKRGKEPLKCKVENTKQFRTSFQGDDLTIKNSVVANVPWCTGKKW